jgi:hypothetical protein
VYLSNAEKEALWLTGYGDAPPWAVHEGLERALLRGSYVPGEESLRLRLAAALDLEERLAAQRAEEAEGETALAGDEPVVDGVWVATDGEDAAPSAVHQEVEDQDLSTFSKLELVDYGVQEPPVHLEVEDQDLSTFSKLELVDYAFDTFGVKLKQSESKNRLIAHVQGLIDEAKGAEV